MPTLWRIAIRGVEPGDVRPEQLHAAMCHLLDTDHKATRKPWSVAPLVGSAEGAELTIGTLSDQTEELFRLRCGAGTAMTFGEQEGMVVADPMVVQHRTWADLSTPTGARAWRLDTISPTALSSGDRRSPMLAPVPLMGSLSHRWEALSPVQIPRLTGPDWTKLWVSDVRGTTRTTLLWHDRESQTKPERIPGFVGSVTLKADNAVADIVDVLLRLAEYSGVGVRVEYGLGAVVVAPIRQGAKVRRDAQGRESLPDRRTASEQGALLDAEALRTASVVSTTVGLGDRLPAPPRLVLKDPVPEALPDPPW